jgi:hypothetical protein
MKATTTEFEKAARELLSSLAQVTGWTLRDLDAHLGFAPGYTSRLFAGHIKLLYSHILLVLDAIGLEPSFFFDTIHPSTSPEQVLELLDRARLVAAGREAPVPPLDLRVRQAIETTAARSGQAVRERRGRRGRSGAGGTQADGGS